MKKFYIILIVVVIVLAVGTLVVRSYLYSPEANTKNVKAQLTKTTVELATAVKQDTAKAKAEFHDKYISFSGKVAESSHDEKGRLSLTFIENNVRMQCQFQDSTSGKLNIKAGDQASVKGLYTGTTVDDLDPTSMVMQFKNCVIEENKK